MKVKVTQSCLTLCHPMDYTVHGILQARILEWAAIPSPGDLPNPGIKHRSPALQADSLPAEPQGKPKNTGMGDLSLLQHIFSTQELNQCLLHCRRILYQLSYQRSPSVGLILITDGAMLFNISLLSGLLFVLHMKLVLSLKNKSVQITSQDTCNAVLNFFYSL